MKPMGVYCVSTWGGIEVFDTDFDRIKFRWNFGKPERMTWARLRESSKGIYFVTRGHRVYLSSILRVA